MSMMSSILYLDKNALRELKVTDAYSVHRVIYSLFPDIRSEEDKANGASSGFLYADLGGDSRGRKFLVLANRAPNTALGQLVTKSVPEGFLNGRHYRFTVIVNPAYRDNQTRRIISVKGRDNIAEWFLARASKWGFTVLPNNLSIDKVSVLQCKKKDQLITIQQAELSGYLEVVDRARFQDSFKRGVGRAKAFGCGLLQLVPVRRT